MPPENERKDQAAEIAADLVESGIIVELCDDEVRGKALEILRKRGLPAGNGVPTS
jgi:hypothetical protein